MACKEKVNQSYIMIILATFDELMLRHDVCSLSFSEIHTWIKKSARHTWKAWRTKEVDWGPSPSSTRPPRHFGPKDGKRSSPTCFGGWIRTVEKHRLVMDATVAYGLGLGHSSTSWKAYQVYFFNGSDLTSTSIRSRPQSSILCRHVFCP